MPQNRQYYRKVKYPDKVAKLKSLVFVRIFLFCSVGIKIQYFPTVPFLCFNKRLKIGYLYSILKLIVYSTVTDFARFRGLSGSNPFKRLT